MADTCRLVFAVAPAGGHQFAVAALELNRTCDYDRHLTALARSNPFEAAKVVQMVNRLATNGTAAFKKDDSQLRSDIGDALLELKPNQQRLLFFQAGQTWIIASAGPKPAGQQKVQSAWITEGKRRKALYLQHVKDGTVQIL